MGWLERVLQVDRKSFQDPLANAGHTNANRCNCGATDLNIHKDTFVDYDRSEKRWFVGETIAIHCAGTSLMRSLL